MLVEPLLFLLVLAERPGLVELLRLLLVQRLLALAGRLT